MLQLCMLLTICIFVEMAAKKKAALQEKQNSWLFWNLDFWDIKTSTSISLQPWCAKWWISNMNCQHVFIPSLLGFMYAMHTELLSNLVLMDKKQLPWLIVWHYKGTISNNTYILKWMNSVVKYSQVNGRWDDTIKS